MFPLNVCLNESKGNAILSYVIPKGVVFLCISANHGLTAGKNVSWLDAEGLIPFQHILRKRSPVVSVVCQCPGNNLQPGVLNQRYLLRH